MLLGLMRHGFVAGLAMNGWPALHDAEIALCDSAAEEVEAVLGDGSFGMADETGRLLQSGHQPPAGRNGLGEGLRRDILTQAQKLQKQTPVEKPQRCPAAPRERQEDADGIVRLSAPLMRGPGNLWPRQVPILRPSRTPLHEVFKNAHMFGEKSSSLITFCCGELTRYTLNPIRILHFNPSNPVWPESCVLQGLKFDR